ncbi:aminotransferase class I/II-fold pyridoxal phosphate-dependent enzyme [Sciscionella sediminilitoris]|uniref:aminotransferase class I/II-fold pyridoxal phosphate-dependent enzyme n=1 Tax=Sciscionella sediminilitoris TaxID=1445613 RepID=UPI0006909D24|nr:aminotransferase class I/II-fold pyridoxal phosphate-dependent enzyme [Sciscionella sp. SE31]
MTNRPGDRENAGDIAIVGIGCRFPGARDVNEYWRLLRAPRPQFRRVPDSRWRQDSFVSDDFRDHRTSYTDRMALLGDVSGFDAAHYGMPPRRARSLDPQHRLLIDTAREAIQDAGWEARGFDREHTASIMAVSESGYREISLMHVRARQLAGGEFGNPVPGAESGVTGVGALHGTALAGLLMNMGPSSVSSAFALHGESYSLDAACSGGLAAIAEAVHALRSGRCRIALAGAAQLVLTPDLLVGLCRVGAISRSGMCRPFDARADGFVLGEGAGVLALRPLADARAEGDRVYAVLRGVGMANDGKVVGNMLPQHRGQILALRRAYADAGVDPGTLGYLEAHGTATAAGDPVEIGALRELRGPETQQTYLGAAKAILGHSIGAAGVAGMIKCALSVYHGEITPQPGFEPAEGLELGAAGFRVAGEPVPWPENRERLAGVSAFGFGGTNVHIVLSGADEPVTETAPAEPQLLLVSAKDRAGLARHAAELAGTLRAERPALRSVAATLAARTPLPEVLAVTAHSSAEAAATLEESARLVGLGETGELGPAARTGSTEPGNPVVARDPVADRPDELRLLAERATSGTGLRLEFPRTAPCTLPPSPLLPKRHWILDEVTATAQPAPTTPQPPAAERPETDPRTVILEEIARTSALPVTELSGTQRLASNLGFDSLMLHELQTNVRDRLPLLPFTVSDTGDPTIDSLIPDGGRTPDGAGAREPAPAAHYDPDTARIESFPEVAAIERRLSEISGNGMPNPYFRTHQGNLRDTTEIDGRRFYSFSSYNYLGLSGDPEVNAAVRDAVSRYGSSVSGSRLLAGERPVTRELEKELAELLGTQASLTLVSGHATNVSAIGHLCGNRDLILHDSLAHDSILQGCALSGATRRPFAHNDTEQLDYLLEQTRGRFRRVLIVAEGVYSMDGDLAPLPELIELKRRHGALLLIDEAHSIGTVGYHGGGIGEHFGVDRDQVDLWMGTLSKSLASCGGYLAGSARTVNWLKYTLPGFVYSAGMTPPNAAAALAALRRMHAEPQRLHRLRDNAALFGKLVEDAGIATRPEVPTPVVPVILGDSAVTLRLAHRLYERGILADPILHPAVEERQTRLRFFITSEHTQEELEYTVAVLREELGKR